MSTLVPSIILAAPLGTDSAAMSTGIGARRQENDMPETTTKTIPLACPHCRSTRLLSAEMAVILYPVRLTVGGQVEYTGESYEVCDEGTTCVGDFQCADCSAELRRDQLVPDVDDD